MPTRTLMTGAGTYTSLAELDVATEVTGPEYTSWGLTGQWGLTSPCSSPLTALFGC